MRGGTESAGILWGCSACRTRDFVNCTQEDLVVKVIAYNGSRQDSVF